MNADPVRAALKEAGLHTDISASTSLSGGCIHDVLKIELADGRHFVAKINSEERLGLFEEEAAGLRALAETRTVLVPQPLAVTARGGSAVLLITAIEPGRATSESWHRFGEELAALHAADPTGNGRYGFTTDNHLGTTFQPNTWCDDWVTFNAEHRLGHQVRLARDAGLIAADEAKRVRRVIDRLDELVPRQPKPALLHGDLWSGNALPAIGPDGEHRIAVIDPACYVGDGWADIAMMHLFGGFPQDCIEAYTARHPDHDRLEQRIAVYQLYHVLNHVNIFGRGYAGQAMSLVGKLGA